MSNVVNFKSRPVSILWSPKRSRGKAVKASWRVLCGSSVIQASERFRTTVDRDPIEWGDDYHAYCRTLMDKYGENWNYRRGFDDCDLTTEERTHLFALESLMYDARDRAANR